MSLQNTNKTFWAFKRELMKKMFVNGDTPVVLPTTDFWYKSRYPDGRVGTVTYIDAVGVEMVETLDVPHWEDDGLGGSVWVEATCTRITASSIVSVNAAIECIP